ncbi:MAG: site-specific DNA-methyltransferase [Candidatus Woesearchaeota archaeon]|jgi:site-specific DNA-methyltransferase (adenine-specific)|nr:site-specific DNA-methyltransferase [Candidatus Woesearchaeota archaeon]
MDELYIDNHRLIKGDCLEEMDRLILEGVKVDAIITDPPYGTTACKWDSVIPFELMWERLNKLIKVNGAIVLFGSEPFSSALRMSNIKNYKYDWVWVKHHKTGHLNAKNRPMKTTENIIVFSKSKHIYNPQGLIPFNKVVNNSDRTMSRGSDGSSASSVINNAPISKNYFQKYTNYPVEILKFASLNSKAVHPTQKPVALMEYLIKTYTNEGETVLDFTMGSFTTAIACLNTKRSFIGIEKDEHYFQVGKDRLEKHLLTLDITPKITYNQV